MSPAARQAKFGNDRVDRWNAEVLEAEFLAKTPLQQELDADWYINWYQTRPDQDVGPNGDWAKWGMMGFGVCRVRFDTCPCTFHVVAATPGGDPVEWLRTWRTGPEHSAGTAQGLFNAVFNEASRKNVCIGMLATLQGKEVEAAMAQVTWAFDNNNRLPVDGLRRFLMVNVSAITPGERTTLQGLVDVRFGPNTISVVRV